MTEIVPYNNEHYEALTSYILDETQSQFSLVPREILDNPEIMENKRRFQYTILHENNVAGFSPSIFPQIFRITRTMLMQYCSVLCL